MSSQGHATQFPLGRDVTLDALDRDPYPVLARLREAEPITWVPATGMWLLTRYDDIVAVLRNTEDFTTDSPHSTIRDTFGPQMLSTDGAEHRRYKTACQQPFTTKQVLETWQGTVQDEARQLASAVADLGSVDLRPALAQPLSLRTMGAVLGIPREDLDEVYTWYQNFAESLANFEADAETRERGQTAARQMSEYLAERLAYAGDDGTLIGALSRGERVTREEAVRNLLVILFGGIETTESMILNALWALLTHPRALADLESKRITHADAIEESLRWEPAVQSLTRHTTKSARLLDVDLDEGETIQCMIGGANRDPARFERPDEFLPGRSDVRGHLSFGLSSHFCLGAALARCETEAALSAVFGELEGVELDETRPSAPRGYEFRKPSELWVYWPSASADS